jgi:hypothetical protein
MRRTKPEVADDIGNWLGALETLSHVNVVTNTVLLYYTHKSYRMILVNQESNQTDLKLEGVGLELA